MAYKPTQAQLMQDLLDRKKMRQTRWSNRSIAIYLCPIRGEIRYWHIPEDDEQHSLAINKLKSADGHIEWEEYKDPEDFGPITEEELEGARTRLKQPKQTKPVIDWEPARAYPISLAITKNDNTVNSFNHLENGISQIINWINNHEESNG